ncbi:MAG: hypothetical protein DMG03_28935 [Acidobacteria bacterium]|nr:MAG: hypothetical protein DMG03_28935 [Acidobacteriota bacterium]
MVSRAVVRVAVATLAFSLVALIGHAQTVGASLQGVVVDPTGAALANADVVVINVATGAVWELKTDATGRYRVPVLQPGEYEIHVTQTGFQTVARRGIQLAVGQDAVIDVRMEIGTIAEELTVTGAAPTINTTSGALSGLVGDKEIRELPLNGRSFQQLALLQTGVTPALAAGSDVVGGRTPKISINGARPEQNSFLLDGTDINNVYNKTPGSSAGVLLGVEAVLEFQVLTNAYSAEFGRSAGGVINAVTRAGTNAIRGSGFEFYRNSALDAKNFFDPVDKPIPDFYRHQFGGVLGGPIARDHTFYFGAFESLIERLGVTGVTAVPDDNARQGVLPGRTVTLHPAVPSYLDTLFPRANGRSLGGGAAEYLFSNTQPTNEYFAQMRIDHRFNGGDTLFARYTFDDGKVDRVPPNKPPVSITKEHSRNQYLTVEHQHLFSPAVLNTFKGGINRSVSLADNVRTIDIPPSLAWLPGEKFGYFTITGVVTEMGGDFRLPRNDYLTNWQLGDTLFWTRGAHAAKFGFQSQLIQFHQNTTSQQGGIVTFPNLAAFLQGQPSNVDFAVPGLIDPIRDYKQWLFGFFAQDDVRMQSNVSLNLGLRYEFITTPTEVGRGAVAFESFAEERRAAARHRVGPRRQGHDVGARRVRPLLRRDPAQVLFLLRQSQSAVHDAHDDRQPAIPERDGELRSEGADPRPAADGELRPADAVHHAVQRRRAARVAGRVGRLRRLCRLARNEPDPHRRREPRARPDRERREDLSAAARTPQSELRSRLPARHRRAVVLRLDAAQRDEALLARPARAGVLHAGEIDRRFERYQLAGLRQQRAVHPRLVRPVVRSRPVGVSGTAQPDVQLELGHPCALVARRRGRRGSQRLAVEQRDDDSERTAVHRPPRVQPIGQPEHDQLLDERASGPEARLLGQSDSRRTRSVLGHQCLRAAGAEHARQPRSQHARRSGASQR